MTFLKKASSDQIFLLILIAIAATIRFWNITEMQFLHDELSALLRAQANSFGELIQKATTTDVHPVGIPIFIHYWTKLFGQSEIAVRFPFIICGLISIYYSYKIAEKWFNPTVALFTVVCLATLQCPTMYGQLARPYATGMLFSVIMVWCWTQFFFNEVTKKKHMVGFVIFASLCAYDHYFCLLFAAIVGATGLFFINKQNAFKYILMCVAVLVLFIPQVSILMYHLSVGSGSEESWLGKPQRDWLIVFLKYLFHYSGLLYLLIGALFFAGIYFGRTQLKHKNKLRIVLLVWAFLGPLMAYLYSITKTPVLQFSSFTFSLPFLLMFIFSFYPELKRSLKLGIAGVLILVNAFTLFANRKHYPLFYTHPYEQMAKISLDAMKDHGEENVSVALSVTEGFVDFYFSFRNTKVKRMLPDYLNVQKQDIPAFTTYLKKQPTNYFVAGNLPPEYIQLIKEKYPFIVTKTEGFTYTIFCFAKTKPLTELKEAVVFTDTQDKQASRFWAKAAMKEIPGEPGKTCMYLDSTVEYSPGFSTSLYEIMASRHSIVNVSADIAVEDATSNPTLVLSVDDKESLIWRGSEYQSYKKADGKFNTVYVSDLFSGIDLKKHPYASIKIYVWNRDKRKIYVKNFKVEVIESNKRVYGLYEP
ncbi:MAG: glycosyltransferase family 39 protein, partial [Bacteroidetes bacterium]|nr:glycosyltransferase family 39 protein [Bacteroidota bacterium]